MRICFIVLIFYYCNIALLEVGAKPLAPASISAVVNNRVITTKDVNDRMKFINLTSDNSENTQQKLRKLVLHSLIIERLQRSAAEAKGIQVTPEALDKALLNIAQNNGLSSVKELKAQINKHGELFHTLKEMILSQIMWVEYIRMLYGSSIQVSEADIAQLKAKIQSQRGEASYSYIEIFFPVGDSTEEGRALADAKIAAAQLSTSDQPEICAQQFSQGSTTPVKNHIPLSQIEAKRAKALSRLDPGEVTNPLRVDGGVVVLRLIDHQVAGVGDPNDREVTFAQIIIGFPQEPTAEAAAALEEYLEKLKATSSCAEFNETAQQLGGQTTTLKVRLRDLPPTIAPLLAKAQVGKCLAPVMIAEGQIVLIMPCAYKNAGPIKMPTRQELIQILEEKKLTQYAIRERSHLQAKAFLDIREPDHPGLYSRGGPTRSNGTFAATS